MIPFQSVVLRNEGYVYQSKAKKLFLISKFMSKNRTKKEKQQKKQPFVSWAQEPEIRVCYTPKRYIAILFQNNAPVAYTALNNIHPSSQKSVHSYRATILGLLLARKYKLNPIRILSEDHKSIAHINQEYKPNSEKLGEFGIAIAKLTKGIKCVGSEVIWRVNPASDEGLYHRLTHARNVVECVASDDDRKVIYKPQMRLGLDYLLAISQSDIVYVDDHALYIGAIASSNRCACGYTISNRFGEVLRCGGNLLTTPDLTLAEYTGLVYGLRMAITQRIRYIHIRLTSSDMRKKIYGDVPSLGRERDAVGEVRRLLRQFSEWNLTWVSKSENAEARYLALKALEYKRTLLLPERNVGDIYEK